MQLSISKPPHRKYILYNLDESTYCKYATVYSTCKCWGVKGIYAFLGGTGLAGVVMDAAKGTVVQYGKRRLATAVVGFASYVCSPAIAVITNTTRIVKTSKVVYTTVGCVAESFEDASQATFIPLDFVLFGQIIPANKADRYTNWGNVTDIKS